MSGGLTLGGNLNVNGFNIGDAGTPDTYIDINSDSIQFFIGPSGGTYWDNTTAIIDASGGSTGENATQATEPASASSAITIDIDRAGAPK